jgi:sulfatase maturation enzyme AslB (radical SAM superfamily)
MIKAIVNKAKKGAEIGFTKASTIAVRRIKKRLYIVPKVPPTVYIELTDMCNLDCIMCDRRSLTRPSGLMDIELFEKVIGDASAIGVPDVKLNRFGEPLLHPGLFNMIEYAKAKGISHVYFTSNATLLDEKKAEMLLSSGLDSITFSVDGATKETYERIRVKSSYDKVVNNIRRFIEMRDSRGQKKPYVVINTIYMQDTKDEILNVFKQWKHLVNRINVLPVGQYGSIENLAPIQKKLIERKPCHQPFDRLMVLWNGDVTVCCADINGVLKTGSVLKSSIGELWKNQKVQTIRHALLAKKFDDIHICETCDGTNKLYFKEMQRLRKTVYRLADEIGL